MDLDALLSAGAGVDPQDGNDSFTLTNSSSGVNFLTLHPEVSYPYLIVLCLFTITGNIGNVLVSISIHTCIASIQFLFTGVVF